MTRVKGAKCSLDIKVCFAPFGHRPTHMGNKIFQHQDVRPLCFHT